MNSYNVISNKCKKKLYFAAKTKSLEKNDQDTGKLNDFKTESVVHNEDDDEVSNILCIKIEMFYFTIFI